MRSITKLVLGLAVSVGLLAISAMPAMAAPVWRVNGTELTEAVASVSEGELELEDSEATFGAVRLKCKIKSTGVVGPKALDKIEAASVTECKVVKGTCGSPKAEGVHFPWNTELKEEASKEVRDAIKNSGAGLPGYKVTCTVIIKVTDTCESETSTSITNNLEAGIVEAGFNEKSGKAKCSLSKKESGTVTGTLKISTKAGKLSAS
jgi:hypothetical protein